MPENTATIICYLKYTPKKSQVRLKVSIITRLMYFLFYQIGVLAFINGGEEGKALYNAFVTGRVCYEVYKRMSVSQADVLRVSFLYIHVSTVNYMYACFYMAIYINFNLVC